MSFIDMMANDVWSDSDITNRTEAMVRAVVPLQEELVLNRKMEASRLGQYTLTTEDQVLADALAQIGAAAQKEGAAARADMALLHKVLAYEQADVRLNQPINKDDPADAGARTAAQTLIDTADQETLALVALRHHEESGVPPQKAAESPRRKSRSAALGL